MTGIRHRLLNAVLKRYVRRRLAAVRLNDAAIAATRARMNRYGVLVRPPAGYRRFGESLAGVPVEWTRRDAGERGVIYYCHGGAFIVGSPIAYRGLINRLCVTADCDVAAIDYRLAPEHPFPAALEDVLAGYVALLDRGIDPRHIVIAGDSAGGNLAATVLARIHAAGLPRPAGTVLLSPWLDLTGSGRSVVANAPHDAMLPASRMREAAELYAPGRDLREPVLSPVFGTCAGLPPLTVHVGSQEILLDDARRYVARARETGGPAELRVWQSMPHVFPIFAAMLPEARAAIAEMSAFVRGCMGFDDGAARAQDGSTTNQAASLVFK